MTEGWIAGMVMEAALKATGWPATPEKLAAAMSTSRSTPRGCAAAPSSGPRTTTSAPSNTIASTAGTASKSAIAQVKDWTAFDVK